ncbi:MAG TPA: energy-coupled thiamine transporter ThiT [Clostridia bacterium]
MIFLGSIDWDKVQVFTAPIALALVLLGVVLIFSFGAKSKFSTKEVTFAAVSIALAFALSFIKLFSMPQGGSLTPASILPLLIFVFYFGWKKGLVVGLIYSILQLMQSPQIYHPLQVLLDYPLAFTSVFVVGFFKPLGKPGFAIGTVCFGLLRYICHVLSGAIFFGTWTSFDSWTFSLAYNSYVLIDVALTLVIGILLLSSKSFTSQIERFVVNGKQNIYTKDK